MTRRPARTALTAALVVGLAATGPAVVVGQATAARAQTPGDVTATPQEGYRAVHDGLVLRFAGAAPAGTVQSAELVGLRENGSVAGRQPVTSGLNSTATSPNFVRNKDGRLEGEVVLRCLFAPPASPGAEFCEHKAVLGQVHSVRASVRLVGVTDPVESTLVPVDVLSPTIREPRAADPTATTPPDPRDRGYSVVAPETIRVLFSEPVRHEQGDSPTDWTVTLPDGRPLAVTDVKQTLGPTCVPDRPGQDTRLGRDLCERLLTVPGLAEDAEPRVEHAAGPQRIGKTYEDFAENGLDRTTKTGSGARGQALDLVRPAAPAIDSVDGGTPSGTPPSTSGGSTAPAVRVSGLTPGHQVRLQVTRPDGTRFATSFVEVTSSSMTLRVPDAPETLQAGDGEHVLLVEAVDDNSNSSTDASLQPARADSGRAEVRYRLDALLPVLVSAQRLGERDVLVSFSEPVTGTDDPLDWVVTAPSGVRVPVLRVEGQGAARTLRTSGEVPAGSRVEYRPVPTSRRYADAARNPVVDPAVALVGAVGLPVLRQPAGRTVTRQTEVLVAGEVEPGRSVEVYDDADDDGRPDSAAPVRTVPGEPGRTTFSVLVPLRQDSPNPFVLLARDPQSGAASGPVDVPTTVQDAQDPRVVLESPRGGEVFAGGSEQEVRYSYEDRNPGSGPVQVLLSLDGSTYTELSSGASATGPFRFRLPDVSTVRARVRLVPRDAAGRVGPVSTSEPFTIDALPPVFEAVTRGPRTVVVTFSEVVSGRSSSLDWRVKGEVAAAAEESRTPDGRTVVTLTTGPQTVIGPDELPEVRYEPATPATAYTDAAGQGVEPFRRLVTARDGIAPAAPSVTSPAFDVLTAASTQEVKGTTDVGATVLLLDARGDEVGRSGAAGADGTWSAVARLVRDATNDLRAVSVDRNGNSSAAATPVERIEQDSTDPAVQVTEPRAGTRVEPGQRVTVRWSSSDRNLVDGATVVEQSTDGGQTFTTLGEQQPASGSLVWTVPDTVTPRAVLRVSTPDRAGRTGRGTSGPLGIGTAAETSSPSPSGVALPPLLVQVSGGSIVPGQLARVTVSGEPGARVELLAYSRPATRYRQVRTGTLDREGRTVFQVRPGTNTRLYARRLTEPKGRDSDSVVIDVRTALSLTVVRNGRRDYTFQGRILPRRAGQLITLYRVTADGRRVITQQIRTDSTGTYRIRRLFTGSGRFGFLTRTGRNLNNVAGESNGGRPRPTAVF